jgi:hypothetical protein
VTSPGTSSEETVPVDSIGKGRAFTRAEPLGDPRFDGVLVSNNAGAPMAAEPAIEEHDVDVPVEMPRNRERD